MENAKLYLRPSFYVGLAQIITRSMPTSSNETIWTKYQY